MTDSETDAWKQFEADADAFSNLTTEAGTELSGLIRQVASVEKDLAAKEAEVKDLKAKKNDIALSHLREIGASDFIKNKITVSFGVTEDNRAKALQADLEAQGFTTDAETKVEPMTLKKIIKEYVGNGKEIDLEIFNASIGTVAKIKGA